MRSAAGNGKRTGKGGLRFQNARNAHGEKVSDRDYHRLVESNANFGAIG